MVRHGPSCLEGPVSRTRPWWPRRFDDELEQVLTGEDDRSGASHSTTPNHPEEASSSERGKTFRTELVERIRREIAEGEYETPEKWEKALQRLLRTIQRRKTHQDPEGQS